MKARQKYIYKIKRMKKNEDEKRMVVNIEGMKIYRKTRDATITGKIGEVENKGKRKTKQKPRQKTREAASKGTAE